MEKNILLDRVTLRALNWRETDKALIVAKREEAELDKARSDHELAIRGLRDAVDAANKGTPP